MKKPYIFGINNFSGVHTLGLKNSVYSLRDFIPDLEIIDEIRLEEDNKIAKNFLTVVETNNKVFNFSDNLIKNNCMPLLFGGDHSIAIGSISATSNNYDNLAIIWVDAHSDIHKEETTISKNIHGMPISYLLGYGNKQLSEIGGFAPKLKPENIVYIGLRDIEDAEKEIIEDLNIKHYYYEDVINMGIENCLKKTLDYLKNNKYIHLQFDFDSMNPKVFPAVSVSAPDGFNEDDVAEIFNILLKEEKIIAIDLVEYNRKNDINNKSLDFAKKLINKILNSKA